MLLNWIVLEPSLFCQYIQYWILQFNDYAYNNIYHNPNEDHSHANFDLGVHAASYYNVLIFNNIIIIMYTGQSTVLFYMFP